MKSLWNTRRRAALQETSLSRRAALTTLGMGGVTLLSACSTDFGFGPSSQRGQPLTQTTPLAQGQTIGNGPVQVALLLPLSGDVATVGQSMENGAQLAMDYISQSQTTSDNITITVRDTGGDASTAANEASQAIQSGASVILGPLKAASVRAAGAAAQSAGVPLIGFSNNPGAASPGVYLLNVLPETEVRRSLSFAKSLKHTSLAAIVPNTDFGRIQEGALQTAASDMGMPIRAVYHFSNQQEAQQAVNQVASYLKDGSINALFLPDRATAPSIGVMLQSAGVDRTKVTIIGSADWGGDSTIMQTNFLIGAIYPAVDDSGLKALTPQYQAKFGTTPHPLTTLAYTATLLANSSKLAMGQPPYSKAILTNSSGFNGRDGLFRFLPDGRSQYALVIKEVTAGGAQRADGPKIA